MKCVVSVERIDGPLVCKVGVLDARDCTEKPVVSVPVQSERPKLSVAAE
jgi:hypothetical protein